ncbi:MAG: SET domain-containing protein-lysine N-methyltransferase [Bdellovibrionales bacterium]|nr:SET domain-containing protein-lysine N-methyltransferase [Bdellovibrionales bacterium]
MNRDQAEYLEVITTAHCGRALQTRVALPKGQRVLEFRGPRLSQAEITEPERTLQVSASLYIGPTGSVEDFVNHSCEPSCRLEVDGERLYLVALDDLAEGAEITFDYATSTNLGDGWSMQCHCGAAHCRGVIQDFSLLPEELQRRYSDLGAVPPYIRLASSTEQCPTNSSFR